MMLHLSPWRLSASTSTSMSSPRRRRCPFFSVLCITLTPEVALMRCWSFMVVVPLSVYFFVLLFLFDSLIWHTLVQLRKKVGTQWSMSSSLSTLGNRSAIYKTGVVSVYTGWISDGLMAFSFSYKLSFLVGSTFRQFICYIIKIFTSLVI